LNFKSSEFYHAYKPDIKKAERSLRRTEYLKNILTLGFNFQLAMKGIMELEDVGPLGEA
jgi:hypothetical protein